MRHINELRHTNLSSRFATWLLDLNRPARLQKTNSSIETLDLAGIDTNTN